jgi:ABC-type transporter Mla MlaB component
MNSDTEPFTLIVAGSQTIREAALTHAALLAAMAEHAEVRLDCAGVTEADVAFVQLILAARRGAVAAGRRFALREPPHGALREALARGGFLSAGMPPPGIDPADWRAEGTPA